MSVFQGVTLKFFVRTRSNNCVVVTDDVTKGRAATGPNRKIELSK